MIGIIVAMSIEFDAIVERMQKVRLETINNHNYGIGKIAGKQIVIAQGGVGKVSSAISAVGMIERYHPEVIVNTGIAGGLKEYENPLDIVISKRLTYHDWDTSPIDHCGVGFGSAQYVFYSDETLVEKAKKALYQTTDRQIFVGDIVSGDQFIVRNNAGYILEHFPEAIASEMEATSVAHACSEYNIPFICIRSLSDIAVKEYSDQGIDYEKFAETACATSAKFIETFLANY